MTSERRPVSRGLLTARAVGSLTLTASVLNEPVDAGYVCLGSQSCPTSGFTGNGNGGVFQVTNVLPTNLILGSSGTLTIYGQGFSSLVSPTAQFASNSGITTGTPTVVNNTTMTVSYQVTCSALLGTYNLTVGQSIDAGLSGQTWPENVVLPAAPIATISLGGNPISGTQSVAVGQEIALSASVSPPPCTTASSPSWSIPSSGVATGGYVVSSPPLTSSETPLPLSTASSPIFYWKVPGNQTITYQYTMSGGGSSVSSPIATAGFNVLGPTGAVVHTCGGNVSSCSNDASLGTVRIGAGPSLEFGGTASNVGINFTASATLPSGYPNSRFNWVQLETKDIFVLTPTNGGAVQTCVPTSQPVATTGTGLDTQYPTDITNPTEDNPDYVLTSTYNEVTRTFTARMYLMWTSGLTNSVPVPLGYVDWQFSGDATLVNATSNTWTIKSGSGSSNTFQASVAYPLWTSYIPSNPGLTCH